MKSLCTVGPQCTIVGLSNTMSGTVVFGRGAGDGQQFLWLCCVFGTRYDFDNFQIKSDSLLTF